MKIDDIAKNQDLWRRIVLELTLALLGRVSVNVRGIALDFDGDTIKVAVYFLGSPSERDVENMQDVEAELVSHHDYRSALSLVATTEFERLEGKSGNWGWVFLRDEGRGHDQ